MCQFFDTTKVAFDRAGAAGYERVVDSGVPAWVGGDLVSGITGFEGGECEGSAWWTSKFLPLGDDSPAVGVMCCFVSGDILFMK
jgi:hypothetical protein